MKINALAIVIVLSLTIISAYSVSAVASVAVECTDTYVDGIVYSGNDINSPVVPNVDVVVHCNTHTQSTQTNEVGSFDVTFYDNTCPLGSDVWACVDDTCSEHATVEDCLDNPIMVLGVDIFNVPEFGMIAGGVAIAGAIAGFLFLRKRN